MALISFSIGVYKRWDWHVLDANFASDAVDDAKGEVAKTDKQLAKHKDRLEDIARARAEENWRPRKWKLAELVAEQENGETS